VDDDDDGEAGTLQGAPALGIEEELCSTPRGKVDEGGVALPSQLASLCLIQESLWPTVHGSPE
jgi:hypothetical protein